ncbi:hypothetical protein [Acidianus hospitalis]|nr:hypothetical protein [Acidianus hospitalis]
MTAHEGRSVDGRVVAFSNKSFAQTSSIVLANIAYIGVSLDE